MAVNDLYRKLLMASDDEAEYAISAGFDDYAQRIYDIARDIYDSCIADYYAQYKPEKYDRHGDITGFNLYSAEDFDFSIEKMSISFDSDYLLPYKGKNRYEVREDVLDNVMAGLRGTGMRSWQDWPQEWYTSYPNRFSIYNDWHSTKYTIDGIFKDFVKNVADDTHDLRNRFIAQYI